jgi:protein-tyrosine phosphatase
MDGRGFFDGPSAGPPLIAVHCEHGKGRSAAIALALLVDHLGDGRERDAVNALLRLMPWHWATQQVH